MPCHSKQQHRNHKKKRAENPRQETDKATAPIQCALVEVNPREWYHNGQDPEFRERFVRAGSRQAIIVPVTRSYPHLTIDIKSTLYFKKKNFVRLSVTKIHYSPSRTGQRHFFREDSEAGVFRPDAMTPELIEIIPRANEWLKQARLPFRIAGPILPKSFRLENMLERLGLDAKSAPVSLRAGELMFRKPKRKTAEAQASATGTPPAPSLEFSFKASQSEKRRSPDPVTPATIRNIPSAEASALVTSPPKALTDADASDSDEFLSALSSSEDEEEWFSAEEEIKETVKERAKKPEAEAVVKEDDTKTPTESRKPPKRGAKTKKKKRRQDVDTVAEQASEFWEEQIKFINIRDEFGVASFKELEADTIRRLYEKQELFSRHVGENLTRRTWDRYEQDYSRWLAKLRRQRQSGPAGIQRGLGKELLARCNSPFIKSISDYGLARLIPERYTPDWQDRTDTLLFSLVLKVAYTFSGIQIREMRYQEKYDFTSLLYSFISCAMTHGSLQLFAKRNLEEIIGIDEEMPKEVRLNTTEALSIPYDVMDAGAGIMEEVWDEYEAWIDEKMMDAQQMMWFPMEASPQMLDELRREEKREKITDATSTEEIERFLFSFINAKTQT